MRVLLAAAAAAVGAVALGAAAPVAQPASNQPARLLVVAREYEFRLSRLRVPAGPVRIEVVNFGEDPHDLELRRPGGPAVKLPVVGPGKRATRTVRLAPGRYLLWCAVGDHRARGMYETLVVVRP
jgi:hypothetical protein